MDFAGQTLTHEAFMRAALYDPEQGYYARRAALGVQGDFSTSATLSPAFAEAVSAWVRQAAERLKLPKPWPVIELGPGDGSLAAGLLDKCDAGEIELHLVEIALPLREKQAAKLAGKPFAHHATLAEALIKTDGVGLIVANEFADAFPAVQLCWAQGDWREVVVQFDNMGEPTEGLIEFQGGVDADAPTYPKEGQRIYVHPGYHRWLQENLTALKKGALLSIDYGEAFPAKECRAYAGQERYEYLDVYRQPGLRDLTCDVNFADLRRWGEQLGLTTSALETQRDFLIRYLPGAEERAAEDKALAFLMQPIGAGGAFMALEQVKE